VRAVERHSLLVMCVSRIMVLGHRKTWTY
jgi:hypothetical protein